MGQFSKPFRLEGHIKVVSFCETSSDIMTYNPLLIDGTKKPVIFTWCKPARHGFIAKLPNVNNKEVAKTLNGKKIFANRAKFADLPDNEFYFSDIENCIVYDLNEKRFGKIEGIHNFGAGNLLEISKFEDNSSIMVVFNKINFPTVDVLAKKVIISPPN